MFLTEVNITITLWDNSSVQDHLESRDWLGMVYQYLNHFGPETVLLGLGCVSRKHILNQVPETTF